MRITKAFNLVLAGHVSRFFQSIFCVLLILVGLVRIKNLRLIGLIFFKKNRKN